MKSETKFKETEIGKVPEEWNVKEIGDVCHLVRNSFSPSKEDSRAYIGLEHIEQDTLRLISIGSSKNINSNKLVFRKGQILFGKLRPYFRKVYRPNFEGVCSTDIFVIDANKKFDNCFLFYFFADRRMIEEATLSSEGTRMPRASWKYLEKLQRGFPDLSEQKAIAKILSDLDSKIELNNEINKTLEAIGQALFKRWFVDFDFPDEKGKPYKSSGGEMVDSELGEMPKVWRIGVLSDIAVVVDCLHSKKPNRQDSGQYLLQVYNIGVDGRLDLSKLYFVANDDYKKWTKRISVKNGDLVISKTGRVGAVAQMLEGFEAGMGRNLVCIRHMKNKSLPAFLKEYLLCPSMKREIGIKTHLGTVLKSLHVKEIEKLRTILPPYEIIKKFEELARPFQKLVNMNIKGNLNLIQIRDSLLPRLMSGRIRVSIG